MSTSPESSGSRGSWAVVTGASSGIGLEMARLLAARKMNLVLISRSGERLGALATELRKLDGIEARVIAQDLADASAIERIAQATEDLDASVLVNSAGFGLGGDLLDTDVQNDLEMVDVNCRALLGLTHFFGRRFVAKGRGTIVLLSSIVAFQGVPRAGTYAATKAFVQSLGEALAIELGPKGVQVLTATPGPTHSGFGARAGLKMGNADSSAEVARDIVDAIGRKHRVTPGRTGKLLLAALSTAPRFLRVRIMQTVMSSMT